MATIAASHPLFCKLNFRPTIISKVKCATKVNTKLVAIIEPLCLGQRKDFDDNKSIYKTKDIHNVKAELCHKNLDALSPIQALMQKLDGHSWLVILFSKKTII